MNIGVHVLFSILFSSGYMPSSGFAGLYCSSTPSFFEASPSVFHSGCISLHFHQQCKRVIFWWNMETTVSMVIVTILKDCMIFYYGLPTGFCCYSEHYKLILLNLSHLCFFLRYMIRNEITKLKGYDFMYFMIIDTYSWITFSESFFKSVLHWYQLILDITCFLYSNFTTQI